MSEQHRTSSHDVTPEQVTGASGAPRWIAFAATGACAILLVVGAFIAIGPTSSSDDRSATSDDANADVDPAPIDSSVVDDRTSDTADPESEPAGDSRSDAPGSSEPDDEVAEDADGFGAGDSAPAIETVEDAPFGSPTAPAAAWTVLDLQPVGSSPSPSPCDIAVGQGSTIAVSPAAATLPSSASTVDLVITYCGAATSTLGSDFGPGAVANWKSALVLQPGETAQVTVVVHRDSFPIGTFATHVEFTDEAGASTTVPIAGMSFGRFSAGTGSGTLSAGGAAPGCSGSCINRAELIPGVGVADVGLIVETNTPATVSLYVFGQPPLLFGGQPSVAGATPIATSAPGVTTWTTDLGDLAAGTTYHLVLEATDGQDRTHLVSHSFTTLAPLPGQFTGNEPEPGCAAQCIVEAQLQATASYHTVGLHVETHTPAKVIAQVGTGITWQDGFPVVSGAVTDATFNEYVTSWDASFEGLAGSTGYHVVVRASDDNGNTDIRTGEFQTTAAPPVGVVVRFEKVLVRWDADSSPINRGELRFAWGINDNQLGSRGESKHIGGDQITLETDTTGWYVPFDGDEEHLFTLAGGERDPKPVFFPPARPPLSPCRASPRGGNRTVTTATT